MIRQWKHRGSRSKSLSAPHRAVSLEPLETRVLFAVTAGIVNGQLIVTGDGAADTITVAHPAAGTTGVNGQFFNETLFPNGIVVNAGGGDDVINLQSSVLTTTVDGQDGTDSVNIGQGGNTQGVLGAVFVQDSGSGAGGETSLTLDDRADTGATSVAVAVNAATGFGTIAGMTPGTITYADARVTPFLRGGSGADVYTINGTDSIGHLGINAGGGNDTFNVRASNGVLVVDGEAGTNQFNVTGANFNTTSVGEIFIDSDGGAANVTVDDSADPLSRTVTLDTVRPANAAPDGVITGLTSGAVHFDLNETKVLAVHGGGGNDTFNVVDLATPVAVVTTGAGNDTFNLQKADASLAVDLVSGTDTVNVGAAGSVQGVRGNVFVKHAGDGLYDLVVDDSADPVARTVGMTRTHSTGDIVGLAPAKISYHLGMRTAVVKGGTGGNTFTVDHFASGAPDGFPGSGVRVEAGKGADTVNVLRTLDGLSLEGVGGLDTFNLGSNGNTQEILGNVFMDNLGGKYNLTLDDAADTQPRNVLVSAVTVTGFVTGVAPALIKFHLFGLESLALNGGSGGNTITLDDPNTLANAPTKPMFINSGLGVDTVNVRRTFQPVTVDGRSGADVVNVGFNGSMQGIHNTLTVRNAGSRSTLNLNNTSDPAGRVVAMGVVNALGSVTGLAPGEIRYVQGDVTTVNVNAGPGGNVFTVNDTVDNGVHAVTTLNTGAGADTVNVRATRGPLTVNGQNGRDTVNVGQGGSVQSIKGTLTVTNSGNFSAINLNDQLDPVGRTVSFGVNPDAGQGSVIGLAPAVILYRTFDVSTLTVNGGTGADTFNINGTAINTSGPAATVLNTGAGADTVNVRATSGPLSVDTGTGNDAINVGSIFNTVDAILGTVSVNGQADGDVLTVNDQGSTTPHFYTVTPTTVSRSGVAAINYLGIETLKLNKGNANTGGTPPLVENLELADAARRGRQVTLTGRLADPDAADTLTLAVDWGDGSGPTVLSPGRDPFAVNHRYQRYGEYAVRVIWTDSTGQSNFKEMHLSVQPAPKQLPAARRSAFVS